MAVFQSKHTELGFYVDGVFKSFRNGRYVTEDKKEIEVLESLVDAEKTDEPKAEAKPKTARKTSAK